ncbi:Nif3-like dinuclear metal center hexameric protein [Porphyromonadaceae bacterium OttesenSCG-928-L07]|nr:Nif3-like dinuclear metal center hexameric protein [Porphyromonadaceae bacterium OttesenSCG-928-L07]MDL2251903.1 Nif3-like dinuclear metal center hexameric protein [Odoribacter sp. OttesenSCG-928-J03]
MIVKDITDIIEEFAPLSLQEDYDNAGLICGAYDDEVVSVLLCTDITEDVVDEAIENNHNMIISHHPLAIKPIKNLLPDTYINRCLIKAIKNNLNIYAAHTNIDSVLRGVSGKMADKLELVNQKILQPNTKSPNPEIGFGVIGELEEETDTYEVLQKIKSVFHCKTIRYTNINKPRVRKIALCGGSGAFLTQEAIRAGADIYISGDFKYHDFFNAENQIIIADIGHYESEQYTKEIFYELVTKKMSKFAVQFSKVNTNPINYI